MLRSIHELKNYTLKAYDGDLGKCKDFLFDEVEWEVHFMVADTGGWLEKNEVLIRPAVMQSPDWSSKKIPVSLTRKEIEQAPVINEKTSASLLSSLTREQKSTTARAYYRMTSGICIPGHATLCLLNQEERVSCEPYRDTGLPAQFIRSAEETRGFSIKTIDGEIGHVDDMIVDDAQWVIRYVVVDTRNLLPGGKKVLISPEWAHEVRVKEKQLLVNISRKDVENSPEYDPDRPVNRKYEEVLYNYYGQPVYW